MRIIFCLMVFLFIGKNTMLAQQLSSFVEYGAALHTGDNTPLWQVSNQQGLTSLDNNTYIRGGISYKHQLEHMNFDYNQMPNSGRRPYNQLLHHLLLRIPHHPQM